jgi:hypothetical protein
MEIDWDTYFIMLLLGHVELGVDVENKGFDIVVWLKMSLDHLVKEDFPGHVEELDLRFIEELVKLPAFSNVAARRPGTSRRKPILPYT